MKSIVYITLFFLHLSTNAQKEAEKWYISGQTALDFSSGSPVPLANNGMTTSWEGCASIADTNGNLLYYTDGNSTIYNNLHNSLTNGTGLYLHNSVTQNSIFIPKPGNPTLHYLFYIGNVSLGPPPFNLYYAEIDNTLSGGLGSVTANKNISIAASNGNCSEKMAATQHCNGNDYWVLVHDYFGNSFKAYLVTSAGINTTPVISNVGLNFQGFASGDDAVGQMKISPNGNKVACMLVGQDKVQLFDFNTNTGEVSNPLDLGATGSQYPYGIEFSPDNTKVYCSGAGSPAAIKQWDLCAGEDTDVVASGTLISNSNGYSLQLAPDYKIYLQRFTTTLGVIQNPNNAGVSCNYTNSGPVLTPTPPNTTASALGLPSFISSFFYQPDSGTYSSIEFSGSSPCGNSGDVTARICKLFGVGPYLYKWSNGYTDSNTFNLSSTVSGLSNGNYHIIISDNLFCNGNIDTLYFTINSSTTSVTDTQYITTCNYYILPLGDTAFTPGTYNDTLIGMATGGCDSIITTILSFNPIVYDTIAFVFCDDTNFFYNGKNYNATGTYQDTLSSSLGCDSILTIDITIFTPYIDTIQYTICIGDSIHFRGNYYSVNGIYHDTTPSSYGCDSIFTLQLSVNTQLVDTISDSICIGDSLLFGGNYLSTQGKYNDTLMASTGCDSIITLVLSIIPIVRDTISNSICMGDSILFGNQYYTATGIYNDTLSTSLGCDSIVTLNLTMLNSYSIAIYDTICNSDSILFNGIYHKIGGVYLYNYLTKDGCDSMFYFNLYVIPLKNITIFDTVCSGDSTLFNSNYYSNSGTYTFVNIDNNGCDSTTYFDLTVLDKPHVSIEGDSVLCIGDKAFLIVNGSYLSILWNNGNTGYNNIVYDSGYYSVTVENANYCRDSDTTYVMLSECIDCFVTIPNSFSPNKDGFNDIFQPIISDECILDQYEFIILNKWGQVIYQTNLKENFWDGSYLNEIKLDTYIWKLTYRVQGSAKSVKKIGHVNVLK